jgi:hypothetical protein
MIIFVILKKNYMLWQSIFVLVASKLVFGVDIIGNLYNNFNQGNYINVAVELLILKYIC